MNIKKVSTAVVLTAALTFTAACSSNSASTGGDRASELSNHKMDENIDTAGSDTLTDQDVTDIVQTIEDYYLATFNPGEDYFDRTRAKDAEIGETFGQEVVDILGGYLIDDKYEKLKELPPETINKLIEIFTELAPNADFYDFTGVDPVYTLIILQGEVAGGAIIDVEGYKGEIAKVVIPRDRVNSYDGVVLVNVADLKYTVGGKEQLVGSKALEVKKTGGEWLLDGQAIEAELKP